MYFHICVFIIFLQILRGDLVKLNLASNGTAILGETVALSCHSNDTSIESLSWTWNDTDVATSSDSEDSFHEVNHLLRNISLDDFGRYVCHANLTNGDMLNSTYDLHFNVDIDIAMAPVFVVTEGNNATLTCSVTGFPSPSSIHWSFGDKRYISNSSDHVVSIHRQNPGYISSTLDIYNAAPPSNGTYVCVTSDGNNYTELIVKSKPQIRFVLVKAVGKSKIYCNWTLFHGNSKIKKISLQYFQLNKKPPIRTDLNTSVSSFIIKNLSPGETYGNFTIFSENEVGNSTDVWEEPATTLLEDPHFVPQVLVNGFTSNTVTLAWTQNLTDHYDFYNVTVTNTRHGVVTTYKAYENPFMVEKLKSGTDYTFRVQACSTFTDTCDDMSSEVNGTTMDGKSGAPRNLSVHCHFDEKSHESVVHVNWDQPDDPKGQVQEYSVTLMGNASFYDAEGRQSVDRIGPLSKTVRAVQPRKTDFTNQPPNTLIFVSVCAKTRSRICGTMAEASCRTEESIPDSDELSKAFWKAVQRSESQQIFFMVTLPHISQRNGTICCLRIVVVRLPKDKTVDDLLPPQQMELLSYELVHNGSNYGAYVAEMLDPNSRNIMIGDGAMGERQPCRKCWSQDDFGGSASYSSRPSDHYDASKRHHWKRHLSGQQHSPGVPLIFPHDGPLNTDSTYTAYIDAIVITDKHQRMRAQSRYFHPLRPVRAAESVDSVIPGVAIVGSLIVTLIVVLVALMCVMRWRRKEPGDQEYGLSHSIQQWCRRLRGQQPIPSEEPPNLPPLGKDELVTAYQERHKDSDLGFQQEFEKLPDRFCDRTSHASDNRDNCGKNRYPDIKAYDQTRIKLTTSENGSDYINANMVVGYKERKKFVCAQGPMEATVVDWWRMIWEQHVHFILMLTNVEEYNKTKCAKYWPSEGSTNYAEFMVTHTSEKRYSDYLVRNLKLSKVRSGTSPEEGIKEEREIQQYHYLVWKDFMAPEHPVGILRFIKRFNEVYGPDKGPILVHCSAGVGRTGTLVALDSLLQQLNEEHCVSIFNTICDLRHQRNYLVQSLKQYIFIYRALMEMSQFGDTDVSATELKSHIEKLKGTADGKTVSRMEEEFGRLVQVIEDRKPFTIGASEENRHRNRHENIIPYDRSRVHLSPMPGLNKEINTYINASFIEGYDNTEQFIIAQDTLDVTIGDFWRMIVEQNIRSIVMLSETGEEKCPRYWPEKDQETSHDYIKVKYMQSQSFPFYYRREFTVTDTKTDHSCLVTQFQYNGWPVGDCEVPQIDRGIVELIDTTFKYKETQEGNVGPMVVHCSDGADRSCIFVALAILVQQMMNESRVDVFSVVRKLRSQRPGLFRNFAQYEFIYRGLHTYAELHVANGNAGH